MAAETQVPNILSFIPLVNIIIAGAAGFGGAWIKLLFCQYRIDTLEKDAKEKDNKISSLIEKVAKMEGILESDREYRKLWERKSPLALTDQGKVVLLDSKGKDFVDDNKDILVNEIKSHNPKSAYDVQEQSRLAIERHSNDEEFVPVKDYVYFKGEKLEDIISVLGLYLRDIALKELGFNISDIKD